MRFVTVVMFSISIPFLFALVNWLARLLPRMVGVDVVFSACLARSAVLALSLLLACGPLLRDARQHVEAGIFLYSRPPGVNFGRGGPDAAGEAL